MQLIDTKLTSEFNRVINIKFDCVVPENIHTPHPLPTTERKFRGEGRGVQKQAISEIGGVASRVFFPGAPSKIDEQAVSYFTVNRSFKARIDDLLFAVG